MSLQDFDENCPGCRPLLLDASTMRPLGSDHPLMVAANKFFDTLTREEKVAWHRYTCNAGAAENDIRLMIDLSDRMQKALAAAQDT